MTSLIGIDVGSTNVKAVLYDVDRGEIIAAHKCATPVRHPRPEWSEYDAEELWAAVVTCVRTVAAAATGAPAGISVATMAEAGLPIDADGRALQPIMAFYDPRGDEFVAHWKSTVGEARIYERTGLPLSGLFGINKIMWVAAHRPDVYAAAERWLCVEDYILYRLCGAYATDYSIAGRQMVFDPVARAWSQEMLDAAGIDARLLPAPYPSGTRIGALHADAAAALGIARGMAVVVGGHDHLCGALTVGVIEPGMLLDSTGTSQAIVSVARECLRHPVLAQAGMSSYNHVVPGMYVVLGGLVSGGRMLEWFIETFFADTPAVQRYTRAFAEAAQAPAVAGVVWLPHILGSFIDPSSRAACLGIDAGHSRGAVLRGLIESIGYALREWFDALSTAGAPPVERVVAIGNSRAADLMQIRADAIDRPLEVPVIDEATALGAALLAGIGAGVFADARQARASLRAERLERYAPNPVTRRLHDRAYVDVFRQLSASASDLNRRLAVLRDERDALVGDAPDNVRA